MAWREWMRRVSGRVRVRCAKCAERYVLWVRTDPKVGWAASGDGEGRPNIVSS